MGVKLNSSGGGSVEINPPSTASTFTLTAPAITDTIVTKTSTDTLTNKTLTSPTITSPTITGASMSSMSSSVLTAMTLASPTSGTTLDFTGIPSWVKRVNVIFTGLKYSASCDPMIQLGYGATTYQASGYLGMVGDYASGSNSYTTGIGMVNTSSYTTSNAIHGRVELFLINPASNIWVANVGCGLSGSGQGGAGAFSVTLSGTLTAIRVTSVAGTATFTTGSVNVFYE